jgi:hypothetical protein
VAAGAPDQQASVVFSDFDFRIRISFAMMHRALAVVLSESRYGRDHDCGSDTPFGSTTGIASALAKFDLPEAEIKAIRRETRSGCFRASPPDHMKSSFPDSSAYEASNGVRNSS